MQYRGRVVVDVLAKAAANQPGIAWIDIRLRCSYLGADAVFDKSTELDALMDFCQIGSGMQLQ